MRKFYTQIKQSKKGFTLIELLLVIAIISILAAVIFVALDPLKRFIDARNSTRWSEVEEILHAIKIDQIDNREEYLQAIQDTLPGEVYMIGIASTSASSTDDCKTPCTALNDGAGPYTYDPKFDVDVDYLVPSSTKHCVNLTQLVVDGYLPEVPISDNNPNEASWNASSTGYLLQRSDAGYIRISACEGEGEVISVQR